MTPLSRLRRWWAQIELDRVDAELARWFVDDGSLSHENARDGWRLELRLKRVEAVRRLERAGGKDPHPLFFLRGYR